MEDGTTSMGNNPESNCRTARRPQPSTEPQQVQEQLPASCNPAESTLGLHKVIENFAEDTKAEGKKRWEDMIDDDEDDFPTFEEYDPYFTVTSFKGIR